jgi:5-methylthioribose kinase
VSDILEDAGTRITSHFFKRGLTTDPDNLQVKALTGGVSNDVFAVTGAGIDVVVKQALGQLRVKQAWLADPARLNTEGAALRLANTFTPEAVPEVLDVADGFLVIARAPLHWRMWKTDLLAGKVDLPTAERLGTLLGTWQRESAGMQAELKTDFGDLTAFRQLRVDPFHRQIRDAYPDLGEAIDTTIETMAASRTCLVHGDYTPKNVLVGAGPEEVWVIDWEVAHLGDPTFDPAWTVGHLLLKSIHQPVLATEFHGAARAFLAGMTAVQNPVHLDRTQLARQTGCLVLARIDGRSPVEYLDEEQRKTARIIGRSLLANPPQELTDIWKELR